MWVVWTMVALIGFSLVLSMFDAPPAANEGRQLKKVRVLRSAPTSPPSGQWPLQASSTPKSSKQYQETL